METKFVITKYNGKLIGCLTKNGKVDDIRCYEDDSLIGNIYVARVSNVLENISAAFVDIKKGLSCYLPLEDYNGDKPIKIGNELIVQVVKDSIKTKQPTVTTNISITGEYVVVHCDKMVGVSTKIKEDTVRNELKDIAGQALLEFREVRLCKDIEYGVILRTKCGELIKDDDYKMKIKNDIMSTIEKLDKLLEKARYRSLYSAIEISEPPYVKDLAGMSETVELITDDREVYDSFCETYGEECPRITFYEDESISLNSVYNIPMTIEKCLKNKAFLKSGGYLVIEPTEAMTVIDVNSGKAIKGKNREEDLLKINIEAAEELARQLRLRNLSGIIIVDFISLKEEKNRMLLMEELKKYVMSDYVGVNVVDITKLGLVEITRKKLRKPLHEIL